MGKSAYVRTTYISFFLFGCDLRGKQKKGADRGSVRVELNLGSNFLLQEVSMCPEIVTHVDGLVGDAVGIGVVGVIAADAQAREAEAVVGQVGDGRV